MTDPSFGAPPPGVAAGDGPSGPRASFGTRFLALLIDIVIVLVVDGILYALMGTTGVNVLGNIVSLAYYTYFEGSPSGQTPGKRAMNIRVVDFNTGGALGYGRAALRWIGRVVSGIPCGLGYFWMLWDKEKQTWHDKISTSVVVPTSAYPVDKWPG